ncbi:hypothetical protein [Stakelama pacifica]|uniref:Terminase small subunit n=1 Tax=Stakelama pacifica TaxID=517720 RepID=A0A4R6FWB8_9SPHN|nr:hypothetical protein [Stakelama pacifica]TDN85590.1 hypothetical protein EV664_102297 [Stakelama pacifica]GGO92199.1 hypothetical protein GCM10011329_08710 [Stakelama pacifica]
MTHGRTPIPPEGRDDVSAFDSDFDPVEVRPRHDGWTPDKQVAFVEALAECGCVDHACGRVGMSASSAYALRRRVDAQSFRVAWDAALDYAVRRLSDAAFSRALNGVVRPVFYQGEQIGERRYYDERLTMFLLRYRDPVRYGAWLDGMEHQRHPDGAALTLSQAIDRVAQDGWADAFGVERDAHDPIATAHHLTEREVADARNQAMDREAEREKRAVLDGIDAIIAEVAEQKGKGQASGEGARGGT